MIILIQTLKKKKQEDTMNTIAINIFFLKIGIGIINIIENMNLKNIKEQLLF
jgi:hypothetical protein